MSFDSYGWRFIGYMQSSIRCHWYLEGIIVFWTTSKTEITTYDLIRRKDLLFLHYILFSVFLKIKSLNGTYKKVRTLSRPESNIPVWKLAYYIPLLVAAGSQTVKVWDSKKLEVKYTLNSIGERVSITFFKREN